jgi:ABC-2 type transport system ATP-binding protein
VLLAEDLSKSYGPRSALRGLSFSLNAGRVMGFLGPNGAGKTTSIRILTTMLEPDSGHFVVDGTGSEYPELIRRKIGVLPENLGFPKQMTGIEYLTYFGQLYGRSKANAKDHAQALIEEVGMQVRAKSLLGTYSHGMRQRIGIARALVNDPRVIFLDEPTLGLDPRGQQELLGMVRRIVQERNVGVILCSHALSEIEEVCDDVIILMAGRVITTGTVEEVIRQTHQNAIQIRVPSNFIADTQKILEGLSYVSSVALTSDNSGWLRIELIEPNGSNTTEDLYANNRILESLIHASIPIQEFKAEGGRLQDVFLQLTEEAAK